jgi:hypothetical protein
MERILEINGLGDVTKAVVEVYWSGVRLSIAVSISSIRSYLESGKAWRRRTASILAGLPREEEEQADALVDDFRTSAFLAQLEALQLASHNRQHAPMDEPISFGSKRLAILVFVHVFCGGGSSFIKRHLLRSQSTEELVAVYRI